MPPGPHQHVRVERLEEDAPSGNAALNTARGGDAPADDRAWRAEAEALLAEAASSRHRRAAAQLHLRAAALHARHDPGSSTKVLDLGERAVLLAPETSDAVVDLLERFLGDRGDWQALASALQGLARRVRDRTAAAGMYLRLAAVDLVRFADPALATAALQRALALDARNAAATQLAFELHVEAGRGGEARSVLERHLASVPERPQHEPWRLWLAEAALAAGDERAGRRHLDAARRLSPGSPRVARALAPLLERAGESSALADVLEVAALDASRAAERAALLRRVAEVRDRLEDAERALQAWREAAAADPAASDGLEDALVRAGRLDEAIEMIRRRLEEQPPTAPRNALLRKLALCAARAGDHAAAASAWRELVAAGAVDGAALQSAAEAIERVAEAVPPERAEERARAFLEAASLRGDRLSRPNAAFAASAAALRACPRDRDARVACERFARAAGMVESWYRLLDETASRCDAATERVLRTSAADVAARDLGMPEEASRQLERCLALAPDDRAAMDAWARVLGALERWHPLCELLERRSLLAQGAERAGLLERLGDVLRERLGAPSRAAAAYRAALDCAEAGARTRLLRALVAALGGSGDDAAEAAALEELERSTDDPAERAVAMRRRSVLLATTLGDPSSAMDGLRAALLADPGDEHVLGVVQRLLASDEGATARAAAEALVAAAEASDDPRRLLSSLELVERHARDPRDRAAAGRRAAHVARDRLGQWSLAFAALQRAVRADPADAEARAEARAAACRVGSEADAVRLYEAVVLPALAGGPDEASAWRELASFQEERGDGEAAARAWGEVVRRDPGDRGALTALARLHREAGRDRDRVSALVALGGIAADDEERRAAWREAAEVLEHALDDAAAAADLWRRIAALSPEDPQPRQALERLYVACDRPRELAEVLEWRRARGGGAADPDLALRLAEVRRTLGEHDEALSLVREVLRRDARHAAARAEVSELLAVPGTVGGDALEELDALHRAEGAHAARALAREKRLAAVDDEDERLRLHREIRAILEHDVRQPALAFQAASRALAEAGVVAADAQPEVERLAAIMGDEAELARAYDRAAAAARARDGALALWRRAARIRGEDASRRRSTIEAWSRVLDLAPADGEALESLERLHAGAGDAGAVADVARRRAALAERGGDRSAILLAGAATVESLGDPERAAVLAEEAHACDPGCAPALTFLARVYRAAGRARELARVLRALADGAGADAVTRHGILLELARVLEDAGEPRAALETYAEVLAEERLQREALAGVGRLFTVAQTRDAASRILEEIHRAQGDARRLAALLEARVDAADPAERGPLLAEIAVLRERLGETLEAFRARARALRLEGGAGADPMAAIEELERLAAAAGAFDELAAAYEDALGRTAVAAVRKQIRLRLAALHSDRIGRPDRAAAVLESLAAESPDEEVLAALARTYRRLGARRELASTLRRHSEQAASPATRKDLLFEAASIEAEQLSDREGAMEAYRQILSVDPEDPNALRLLGGLLHAAERWDELVEVLDREVGVADRRPNLVAEAAELRFRLGRIRQQRLADTAGALQCYRGVLERVPRHPAALAALEEILAGGGDSALEAATLLEPIYEQEAEHAKLVRALEIRAAAARDPSARAALLQRIAEVQGAGLRSPELAFLTASRAVREDPDRAESIAVAARFAEAASLHEELATLLGEIADRLHDARARLELRRQIAHLAARSADPRRVAEAWSRVLDLAPDDGEALAASTDAYRAAGDRDALAQALRRRIAVTDDAALRASILAELAELQEMQQDAGAAMATLRSLLEIEPTRRDALASLDRLCVAAERWVELGDVLGRELAAAERAGDRTATAAFRQRLAELKETRLLDREGALSLYEQILADRPDDAQASARLEAMLERDPANARAAAMLERAYAAIGAWGRYAAVVEVRAAERPDPVERKALLLELAEVQEQRLGSAELAFTALCRAFREDPSDPVVRSDLQRLALASGHVDELAAVLEDEFDGLPAPAGAEVALTLGTVHDERLGDPRLASDWFERARRLDASAAPQALVALDRLHRATGRHEELAGVLEAEAALAAGEERAAFLFRLGQLCEEQLHDGERAARAYEAIVAEQPSHGAALRALEGIYEAQGRLGALAENLAAQRDLASEGPLRLQLTARLASAKQSLGDHEGAIVLWREALALDPRHEPALAALEALYDRLERWVDLAELLEARVAATADRRESARIHEKLAILFSSRLGDVAAAVRCYQGVLDADPRNRAALEALRVIHERQGDVEALASVYRRLVALQEDAAGVKAVRMQLAEVLLRAGNKREAADQARRALEMEPNGEAELSRLGRVFEAADAPQDMVRALEARAALLAGSGSDARAVESWLAAADLWQRRLGKADSACVALERVLALEPAHRGAWSQLRELYARVRDWRAYARISDLFTPHLPDRAERIAVLKEVGEIHEKRLGQKEMAFICLCRAFGEEPGDESVAATMHRLAAETQAWDELAAVYEQVAHDATGAKRAALLLELGTLRDVRLDDVDGAEAAFRDALAADPASPRALDALTGLFTRRGRVRDLVIALEHKVEAAADLDEKKATLMEVARIYQGQLHDPGEAIAALKRLLELDGRDAAALEMLAGLYRRQARWGDLAGILARTRDLANDDATRVACQMQIAGLYENELADDEAAVDAYRAVLAIDDRQRDAMAALERLYTKLERFAELNAVCERQAELASDPREKVRLLLKSAAILEEKLHDTRRAIEQDEAALALDPGSVAALKALEASYRRERAPEKLIAVLQQHTVLTRDPAELVALEVEIGEVAWHDLGSTERAESMFAHALQLAPESRPAISALARLHEENGRWNLALEMLRREAALARAGREIVELQSRIARIEEQELQDRAAAKAAYARAIEADPGHVPSLRALRAIAGSEGDRDAYLRLLLAEARYSEDRSEKASLLHEAGRIQQEERDDADAAASLYEEALRNVPDFLPAARPLADLHVSRCDWNRAEQVLEAIVTRLAQEGDTADLCRQVYRLGYVADKRGDTARALECHRRAYGLDATYLPALEALAPLLVQAQAWDEALKVLQAMLIHHRDSLTDLEVVDAYSRIGEIHLRLGQPDRAANSFEKALEIDAGHERARRSLVEVLEAAGDWQAAVEHRRKLLRALDAPAQREMYVAIAKIWRDRLQDRFQAVDAFTAAARLDPSDDEVVEALLALYRETRQGQKAADVLRHLLESPAVKADSRRAARLHQTLASTLRDDLKDEDGAAAELERALERDPQLVEALAALESLLGRSGRWQDLEQAYVRMIQRLPRTPAFAARRVALWKALGELYRRVLDDPEKARMAFEVVADASPDDASALEVHAELAAKVPGHESEAIASYRRLLAVAADPRGALSQLVRLHGQRRSYDEAYSAAQALTFLAGAASPDEAQVVSRLRRFARASASGALDGALWEKVLHDHARGPLATILALLVRDAYPLFVQQPKDLALQPRKDELDVQESRSFFVDAYRYVARSLGLEVPRLFRSGSDDTLRIAPLETAAFLAGDSALRERPRKELWFRLGKAMAFLRPELMLARLMPHDQLEALFQAAASLGTSRFVVSADARAVRKLRDRLENVLPEATRTQTLKLLARKYCDVQRPGDIRAYMDAAELTSNRVGALLAGDLDVVRRMIAVEKPAVSKLREEVRLRDLVLFCTSQDHAALREQLGLSVVVATTS